MDYVGDIDPTSEKRRRLDAIALGFRGNRPKIKLNPKKNRRTVFTEIQKEEPEDEAESLLTEKTRETRDRDTLPHHDKGAKVILEWKPEGERVEDSAVKHMQENLHRLGYDLDPEKKWGNNGIDGFYGDDMKSAVKEFQKLNGITQTGNIDQRTWEMIIEQTRGGYNPKKKQYEGK